VLLLTLASFCSGPAVSGNTRTTIVIVRLTPEPSVSKVQTLGRSASPGTPALQEEAAWAVTDWMTTPAGSKSRATTATAGDGPVLVIVTV
jgi:hypothetical protein